jgi:SAM-dependent methyltransferase
VEPEQRVPPVVVTSCPACGGSSTSVAAVPSDSARERFLEFSRVKYRGLMDGWLGELSLTVLRCQDCAHHWYREQPDEARLFAMYEAAVRLVPGSAAGTRPVSDPFALAQMGRLRRLCVPAPGARPALLDFGSGFGHWPTAGVAAGFTVCAFEPSRSRARANETPFELVHDLAALEGRTFDAINVEQVLEHVPDPLSTLRQIRTFCSPRTVVRITVPNMLHAAEGRQVWTAWPFDGTRPHTLAPFEHLHGFTPRSLDRLSSRAGFGSVHPARLWRHYPIRQFRSLLGLLVPRLDSTFRLVSPSHAGVDRQR